MAVLIVSIAPAFWLTHVLVSRYRDQRQHLAADWSAQGVRDLSTHPVAAVLDFQTALSFEPERSDNRFQLAKALMSANRLPEAKAQLLTLWTEEPGDGEVNLELARLAATDDDMTNVIRYYHAAIDGAWQNGAGAARRTARLELAQFLIANWQPILAQAELIALIDDLPPDPPLVTHVGQLLLDAGASARALGLFDRALTLDPTDATAAVRAGEIEFRAGDFRAALRYLRTAAAHEPLDRDAQDTLILSERVLALDPYLGGISAPHRAERTRQALVAANARLGRCEAPSASGPSIASAPSPFRAVRGRIDAAAKVSGRALARDADLIDSAMSAVFDVEKLSAPACGPDTVDDRALAIIASQRALPPQ